MTDEEMQRAMQFIVEQQARFAANMQRAEEERAKDTGRITRLENASATLAELLGRSTERTDRLENASAALAELLSRDTGRVDRLENAFVTLTDLLTNHEERMDTFDARLKASADAFETRLNTLNEKMSVLAEAQTHTDERLSALINVVERYVSGGRNGGN